MPRTKPPFRADMVGSLLRPSAIKSARAAHGEQRLDDAGLREVEDREIRAIVRKQEEIGLQAVTDGEFRRSWWHFDFYRALDGCELREAEHGIQFHGIQTKAQTIAVTGKIDFPSDHPMLAHFTFLKSIAHATPKMTIPSPSVLHFRQGYHAIKNVYPDIDAYFDDLANA